MGRYGDIEYERMAKAGFLFGLAAFALGAGGELLAAGMHWSLPAWEHALLVDMEVVGTLLALFSPLVFGIILPLTE